MVALIDDFERRGLVVRRPNAGDRRRYAVHLTDAGREVLERARGLSREVEARLLAPLAEGERALLHEALVAMAEAEAIPLADPVRQASPS